MFRRVATATLIEGLFGLRPDGVKKALRCQEAEHTFAGTPCGIMDQYISAMGKSGNLLLLDCKTNTFQLVPFGKGEDSPIVLVTNSKVKHELSGSEYPDRVNQCKRAVEVLKNKYPHVNSLRDATIEMLKSAKADMEDVVFRRARHVIDENDRTLATVKALESGNYEEAGKYMTQSHNSLRDDYEVSCEELDFLVKVALDVPGVYGSRMTGGGFGGCTVTLVARSAVKELEKSLRENYFKQYDLHCECYEAVPSDGARFLDLKNAAEKANQGNQIPWSDYIVPGLVIALSVGVGLSFILSKK
jgi:galactokinase